MKIAIGSDHGGLELKENIRKYLKEEGIDFLDLGTDSDESVDYPEFGYKVSKAVKDGECDLGIVCCGTGIGISISANKVKGVRCALCSDCYSARMAREHNNANVLALGGRVVGKDLAIEIVDTFLKGKFQGGRHERRVNKITDIEKDNMV
ncbi:MAG: ribose 5-phosphate isomerase B [Firmicutes bacterium]|nr:ribose 5-phosphate isomerase B [Bacillota bacterium]